MFTLSPHGGDALAGTAKGLALLGDCSEFCRVFPVHPLNGLLRSAHPGSSVCKGHGCQTHTQPQWSPALSGLGCPQVISIFYSFLPCCPPFSLGNFSPSLKTLEGLGSIFFINSHKWTGFYIRVVFFFYWKLRDSWQRGRHFPAPCFLPPQGTSAQRG